MPGLIQKNQHEVTDGKGRLEDARAAEFDIPIPTKLAEILGKYGLGIEVTGQVSIRLSPSQGNTPSSGDQTRLTAFRQSAQPGVCAKIPGMMGHKRSGAAVIGYPIKGNGHTAQEAVEALVQNLSGTTVGIRPTNGGAYIEVTMPEFMTVSSSGAAPEAPKREGPRMIRGG